MNPIRTPSRFGSAAIVVNVSVRLHQQVVQVAALFWKAIAAIAAGGVKTT